MASNTFTVRIPDNLVIEEVLAKVQKGIQEAGGTFYYFEEVACFTVRGVIGKFSLSGRNALVTIEKKPFLISHSMIEKAIRSYFV